MSPAATAVGVSRRLWPVGLAIFAIGVCCGVAQVVLIRQLLIVCSGSELTVGIILGVWLFSGALGCWWAGRQARADRDMSRTAARVVLMACFGAVAGLCAVAVIRISPELFVRLPGLLSTQRGEMFDLVQIIGLTVAATLPAAFTIEAQFGGAISLYAGLQRDASAVARSYALDAVGHLAGGSAAAYLLTVQMDPHSALTAVSLLSLFAALLVWALVLPPPRAGIVRIAAIAVLILAPAALAGARMLDERTLHVRWHEYELLANVDTLQSNIVVARHGEAGRVFFINGQPAAYTETMPDMQLLVHFTMLQHPNPRRVLLLGGLGTGAVDEVVKHDIERLDYFELDPGLLPVYARHRGPLPTGRVHVWQQDLRTYLRHATSDEAFVGWDVVIIALPPPLSALVNRYYTLEWFQKLAKLQADTIIGMQLPGTQTYYSADLLRLNSTLLNAAGAGPDRQVVMMPGYSLYVALGPVDGYMSEMVPDMLHRLAERGVSAPFWESIIYDHLEPMNIVFVRQALENYPAHARNTDLRPVAYFYNQIYAMRQFHPRAANVMQAVAEIPGLMMLLVVAAACLLAVAVLWLRASLRRFAVPAAIAGSGFIGMTLQLAALYGFQVFVGHIYSLIGVLSGAFMVGIAGGGLLAGRLVVNDAGADAAMRYLCLALAVLAAAGFGFTLLIGAVGTLPFTESTWAMAAGFFAVSLFIGALVGVQFPLATEASSKPDSRGPMAAAMYAADLVGASSGALLAGAFLVPLFGIGTAGVLSGILASALLAMCLLRLKG